MKESMLLSLELRKEMKHNVTRFPGCIVLFYVQRVGCVMNTDCIRIPFMIYCIQIKN